METNFKGQAHDLAPTLVLVSAVRRDSAAMRARRLWKPVLSPLAFRHLLVVLCEPQLSQSRRRKSSGGSAIGTSLRPVRLWKTNVLRPVRCRQRPPAPRLSQYDRSIRKLDAFLGGPTVKFEFAQRGAYPADQPR